MPETVDPFLLEALQNPRQRLTSKLPLFASLVLSPIPCNALVSSSYNLCRIGTFVNLLILIGLRIVVRDVGGMIGPYEDCLFYSLDRS